MRRFFLALTLALLSEASHGFQLYTNPLAIHGKVAADRRSFRVLISSTYHDFQLGGERPLTPLHRVIVMDALKRFSAVSGIDGLSFTYAGTFEARGIGERIKADSSDPAYEGVLYYDLSGAGFPGTTSDAAGRARHLFNGDFATVVGGYIQINTKVFDLLHPDVNLSGVIIHETMHVFGLDHSSSATARMSYKNPTWFGISDDDRLGLKQIFGDDLATEITIRPTLDGAAAAGVEIALIDTETGRSYVSVSGYDGVARIKHIPVGSYWILGREITPTGPCFTDPATGFLSSFYQDSEKATNRLEEASSMLIAEGEPLELTLPLIVGVKRYDCYYGSAMSADWWDNNPVLQALFESARPGAYFASGLTRDVDVPEVKSTSTVKDETAYPLLNVTPLGSSNPISVEETTYEEVVVGSGDLMNLAKVRVRSDATPGVYATMCGVEGEYSVMHSFVEVRDDIAGEPGIDLLYPEYAALMTPADAKPSLHMPGERIGESKKVSMPKSIGPLACGVIGAGRGREPMVLVLLLWPILAPGLFRRKGRNS